MNRAARGLLGAAMLASGTAAFAQTKPAGAQEGVLYATVTEAQAALRAKAGVTFSTNGDWTIAKDTDGAIWSFTPANHYAHPSVGRRRLLKNEGTYYMQTDILCQTNKSACDRLRADYELLDRRMNEAILSNRSER